MLKLYSNGTVGYVNKDAIIMIKPEGLGSTIRLCDGTSIFVDEAPDAILKLMKPAPKKKEV